MHIAATEQLIKQNILNTINNKKAKFPFKHPVRIEDIIINLNGEIYVNNIDGPPIKMNICRTDYQTEPGIFKISKTESLLDRYKVYEVDFKEFL